MTGQAVYKQGWTLDDVQWSSFDPSKAEPWMIAAIKAAALVEFNAPDYVSYLKRVFKDAGPATLDAIEQWGCEESQHGRALGRWAEMADPTFKLDDAFARFRAGYTPEHFATVENQSIRGSRRGEMIARCVVESGTSSYYSAIRDATEEPVLKEIAGRIAADEYRHYKLFYDTLQAQDEPDLPFWKKLMVAIGRVTESDDDELAYAYYCANVSAAEAPATPYDRAHFSRLATQTGMRIYRRNHINKLVQMVAKVVGAAPHGRLSKLGGALLWRMLRLRAGSAAPREMAAVPA
ncbi:MAG: ferritin-like domain-containing protein [Alphaproteobacteria bacterium]|nr:ferritin-like domain-containing protein [Alphaproteobacteria bacterium]MBV9418523.1 ferritin-like domain-containing protein [Alphaproteobacteria bacterium]MBV9542149.1 ferritin-like domain-containing protein [Alphaproteobacteria bacterium]